LESTGDFQVAETKCKKVIAIFLENKVERQSFKKAKEKKPERYYRDTRIKIEVLTPVRSMCAPGKIVWYTT